MPKPHLSEHLSNIEQYIKLAEKTIRSNPETDNIEDYHLIPLCSENSNTSPGSPNISTGFSNSLSSSGSLFNQMFLDQMIHQNRK